MAPPNNSKVSELHGNLFGRILKTKHFPETLSYRRTLVKGTNKKALCIGPKMAHKIPKMAKNGPQIFLTMATFGVVFDPMQSVASPI